MDQSPPESKLLEVLIPAPLRGRYLPVEEIGVGGMGRVILAREEGSGKLVAIKRMTGEISEQRRARFHREAVILAEVSHPTIPAFLSHGDDDQGPYLVMQYIEGTSLEAIQDQELAVASLIRVTGALDALHERGLIHRDVKPANVMLEDSGRVFLVDLGLVFDPTASRLSGTGGPAGTAGFVAPELLMEKPASPRSDWFAWGASLFALRERRLPYTLAEVVQAAAGLELPPREFRHVDPQCAEARVILACLSPNPKDRPTSGVAIRDMLAAGPAPRDEFLRPSQPDSAPKPELPQTPAPAPAPDGDDGVDMSFSEPNLPEVLDLTSVEDLEEEAEDELDISSSGIVFSSEEVVYIGFDGDEEDPDGD